MNTVFTVYSDDKPLPLITFDASLNNHKKVIRLLLHNAIAQNKMLNLRADGAHSQKPTSNEEIVRRFNIWFPDSPITLEWLLDETAQNNH